MRTLKFIYKINFNTSGNNKYDPTKLFIDLDDLNISEFDSKSPIILQHPVNSLSTIALYQKSDPDNFIK